MNGQETVLNWAANHSTEAYREVGCTAAILLLIYCAEGAGMQVGARDEMDAKQT